MAPSTPQSRRQHLHWRQAAVFSLLIGVLVVVLAIAVGMWTGTLQPLFNSEFSYKPSESPRVNPVPCPTGTDPIYPEPTAVVVKVLNGTNTQGLAGETASTLASYGFPDPSSDNTMPYDGVAKVVVGILGVNNGYTLLRYFPEGSILTMDRREDAGVDVVLGTGFKVLEEPEGVTFDPPVAITPIQSCQRAEAIVAKLGPSGAPEVPADPEAPVSEDEPAEGTTEARSQYQLQSNR